MSDVLLGAANRICLRQSPVGQTPPSQKPVGWIDRYTACIPGQEGQKIINITAAFNGQRAIHKGLADTQSRI